ncbi:unnamed protein product [Pleuronectes platessa]|uniref:Uncharacterized protein n=1 Tax=Pleuronectes platessa TaxID=8262 RepID=A0A9N7YJ57_PLEPL|nr:unnamed protein product [Pleuronectes platessa]
MGRPGGATCSENPPASQTVICGSLALQDAPFMPGGSTGRGMEESLNICQIVSLDYIYCTECSDLAREAGWRTDRVTNSMDGPGALRNNGHPSQSGSERCYLHSVGAGERGDPSLPNGLGRKSKTPARTHTSLMHTNRALVGLSWKKRKDSLWSSMKEGKEGGGAAMDTAESCRQKPQTSESSSYGITL